MEKAPRCGAFFLVQPPADASAGTGLPCPCRRSRGDGASLPAQEHRMTQGTQHSADDPRNADILISINGAMKHRSEGVVSVFDSGFVLGDGVWEGFRVVAGHPAFLDAHLDRLYEGARAIMLDIGLDRAALT